MLIRACPNQALQNQPPDPFSPMKVTVTQRRSRKGRGDPGGVPGGCVELCRSACDASWPSLAPRSDERSPEFGKVRSVAAFFLSPPTEAAAHTYME